ncbi:conserved Plasmodium protein, unknown function [Plasmodium gallinaceum]|uniref:Ketoreductase (KR) domain-containing protein n=1 Tax=Plasmodium gallinaceum TaxID=5849 RepID=A0A1J1GZX0_PLAGA|nr:conserved Plasmodium protein, unknown function [Plasmodium gallinaceum]CRG98166.1 conserved Plasmodium protein, unknown function [Plasmodium gallinaceum]
MLDYFRKYIYFELLLILFFINYRNPLNVYINIAIIFYLTLLGLIYLIFKFKYTNYKKAQINYNLSDKHICIIGGSEGLGLSLAKRIIKEKPKTLTLMSRNIDKLKEAKKYLLKEIERKSNEEGDNYFGIKINIIKCDISIKESIKEAFDNALTNNSLDIEENEEDYIVSNSTRSRKQKIIKEECHLEEKNYIDVLICNAAYVTTGEYNKLQLYDLIYTINTNIYGNIDIMSKVIINMKKKKSGLILFINTEGVLYPIYGFSYYLMSKSSMWTYTYILDQELKYFNIHIVNAFLPSVDTPGFAQESIKKPDITKKLENLTNTLNSDYVADKVINNVKKGKKFITLEFNGYILSILHSNYRNPESYFDYLIYVSFSSLIVFISSLYKLYIEYVIKKGVQSALYN